MTDCILDRARRAESLLSGTELCGAEAARARQLIQRLENKEMTVAVIGQFKRGKSTLVNGILGEKLLPVGIVPVTSAVTRIVFGEQSAEVRFDNGVVRPIEFGALSRYINEQDNPDNRLGVASVTLKTPAEFLKEGLVLVDTPGVGSFHRHNSDAAYAFVKESDAVIFMLSVDSPINEIEIEFLRNAAEYAAKFYFAVNKIDTVEKDELELYLDYCKKLLCRLMETEHVQMFPISAKSGSGLSQLKEAVKRDCETAAKEILDASAERKLRDILVRALAKLNLYWNALNLPPSRFDDLFTALEEGFAQLEQETEKTVLQLKAEREELCGALAQGRGQERSLLEQGRRKMKNSVDIHRNEVKKRLSALVADLFGIEYYFELEELKIEDVGEGKGAEPAPIRQVGPDELEQEMASACREETEKLCSELKDTMNRVLLYREHNAYTVARRIEDVNQLSRKLRQLRDSLGQPETEKHREGYRHP